MNYVFPQLKCNFDYAHNVFMCNSYNMSMRDLPDIAINRFDTLDQREKTADKSHTAHIAKYAIYKYHILLVNSCSYL